MKQAIGLVEVKGLASAIEVSDTMVKVANVELLGVEKARGFGWMTVEGRWRCRSGKSGGRCR